jgi:hypothetical protein
MGRETSEYRLVGGGTTECRQLADRLARGGAGGERATRVVGFVCSLAGRAGPSPLFSRPDSLVHPRGWGIAWDLRMELGPFPWGNKEPRGAAGPNNAIRMKKGCRGPRRRDGWRFSKSTIDTSSDDNL